MLRTTLLLALLTSCAEVVVVPVHRPGSADYDQAASKVYGKAVGALQSGEYIYARQRFQEVQSKFPYSQFAALAELGLADTHFAEGAYLQASELYRTFVKLRPTHPKADYAAYREGLSLQQEAPSDFFLFPPAYEKDLTQVRETMEVLRRFTVDYPDSEWLDEARALLDESRTRLAEHELYVADFYRARRKWRAVMFRLETMIRQYPGLGYDDRAKVELAEAYLRIDEPKVERARELLLEVLDSNANADLKARARALQRQLPRGRPSGRAGDGPSVATGDLIAAP